MIFVGVYPFYFNLFVTLFNYLDMTPRGSVALNTYRV